MRSRLAQVMVWLLPIVAGALGYAAGPYLAGAHRTVRLAREVRALDTGALKESTFELDAFRVHGRQRDDLFAEAKRLQGSFRTGGMWLGVWCGLVLSLKLSRLKRPVRRREYETDAGHCLSCGRCFLYCPRERKRLKGLAENVR